MTARRRPVVVGVDGSPESQAALDYAVELARSRDLPLRLVHALEPENLAAWSTLGWTPDLTVASRDSAQDLVDEISSSVRSAHPGVEVEAAMREGTCRSVLVAESTDADTVVVGSRRSGALASVLLRSTGFDVGAKASCPLIAVPYLPADPSPRSGVVVGVDGSEHSQHTLAYAFGRAAELAEPVLVVHSWTEPPVDPSMASPLAYDATSCAADERAVLSSCLAGWQERYPDVEIEECLRRSRPVTELVTRSAHARLLVIGSHGSTAWRTLLGSVGRGVLHSAQVPVAIIHGSPRAD